MKPPQANVAPGTARIRNASGHARLMAHMVPGYPDMETSYQAFCGISDGGAEFLEVQFPFSDPTADGPVIEAACNQALNQGFTVDKGFSFIRRLADYIAQKERNQRICIMSYANIVFRRGVEKFCRDAAAAGAWGLIIPDLPFDSDEGLLAAARAAGLAVVPVLVPTNTSQRIERILEHKPQLIYAVLRTGITGTKTQLGPQNLAFLDALSNLAKAFGGQIYGGFGVQEKSQIVALEPHLDGVVVGTAMVRRVKELSEAKMPVQAGLATMLAEMLE